MLRPVLLVSFAVIALVHIAGLGASWYWNYLWLDTVMHLAAGAWVALLFFYLFCERSKVFDVRSNFALTLLAVLGFVALAGVLWEFYEYFHDNVIIRLPLDAPRPHPNLYLDTLKDFLNDLIGGFTAVLAWRIAQKYFVKFPTRRKIS